MRQAIPFETKQSSALPILLGLVSLFVGIFFTYDMAIQSFDNSARIEAAMNERDASGKLLETLNGYERKAKEQTTQGKLVGAFREDIILEQVFSLIGSRAQIGGITLTQGEKLSTGLYLATISVNIQTNNLEDFLSILDDATVKGTGQKYMIRGLSVPYASGKNDPVTTVLQLGMYHTGK